MKKTYEITFTAEVENEDDIQAWLEEHNKSTDKVNITKWGIDLYQQKYTINLKDMKGKEDQTIITGDLEDLLIAIRDSKYAASALS